ncbi:MAG: HAD-IIIA family hydrolase [Saprospiraceae bacterium]|nr:HAD-IIIA family hydrolase [Saprospiraceae bacterium]
MMIPNTAIILAGGRGTRLQTVVSDLPKPLAPVADRPFLAWQLDHLASQGIQKVILSIGYLADHFLHLIGTTWKEMQIEYVIEEQPLGTGGAIYKASKQIDDEEFWVLNGDTFTDFCLADLWEFHRASGVICTLALKQMEDVDRYGTVQIDSQGQVLGFAEKRAQRHGLINAGVYLLHRRLIPKDASESAFSFETDVLQTLPGHSKLAGLPVAGHFLDIGIPDDYYLAQTALPAWTAATASSDLPFIDSSWTLFLDRDGVINERIPGDYVCRPDQFHFLPGVPEALAILRGVFGRIVIVTNQQGIGKNRMTVDDLNRVHLAMTTILEESGVHLDGIYFCPDLESVHPVCRKPLPGMALQAFHQFPDIRFSRSVLIGDSESDVAFGNRLGMVTIRIGEEDNRADLVVESLAIAAACLLEWCR